MTDARPTLSREHSRGPEFVQRHANYCLGGLDPDADDEVRARALPQLTGRYNARAHEAEDGSEVHHDAGEALSFCIALLNALGFDIPTRSHGSKSAAVTVTAPWGINVLGREDDEDEAEVDA
jgi:hypothetical protein